MGSDRGAEEVVRLERIRDPGSQGLIDRRAQCLIPSRDGHDLRTQQSHAPDGWSLALHINGPHVYGAGQPEPRTSGRACDTVLARSRLGHDSLRANVFGQQSLTDGVVDLVCVRVREILSLQPDVGAPALGQSPRKGERRGTANPGFQLAPEVSLEVIGVQVIPHPPLEPLERRNEGLRYIATAKGTEAALRVGEFAGDGGGEQTRGVEAEIRNCHRESLCATLEARAAVTKRAIWAGLLTPGRISTPVETSTPNGCTCTIADATLLGFRPPASTSSVRRATCCAAVQSQDRPVPLARPSNKRRGGRSLPSWGVRSTGRSCTLRGSSSACKSTESVCRTSGLKSCRIWSMSC